MHNDVVVIGGGVMGSALAYWLTHLDPTTSVTVIERDPSYAIASSALSAASIRQQFTTAINIRISQQSIAFLRDAGAWLEVDDGQPDIGLIEGGYLYLAGSEELAALRAANLRQRAEGANVALLDRTALGARFPWLNVADLAAGALGLSGEGWFDGYALLMALVHKARSQGAHYVRGEVNRIEVDNHRITALGLADGTTLKPGWVVNAAGPWARAVAQLAGVELPVYARRRTVFVIACRASLPGFPLLIDRSGCWIRPEREHFIGAAPPGEDPDEPPLEPDVGAFESTFWPAIAARVPAFEAAKLERSWAGYYEFNSFDQNGIVGLHPSLDNLAFMNGFSGHGIQQAPVIGRGIAELILTGRYGSLDLAELGLARLLDNRPLRELNVIG